MCPPVSELPVYPNSHPHTPSGLNGLLGPGGLHKKTVWWVLDACLARPLCVLCRPSEEGLGFWGPNQAVPVKSTVPAGAAPVSSSAARRVCLQGGSLPKPRAGPNKANCNLIRPEGRGEGTAQRHRRRTKRSLSVSHSRNHCKSKPPGWKARARVEFGKFNFASDFDHCR